MPISKMKRIIVGPSKSYDQDDLRSLRTYKRKRTNKKLSRNVLYTPMGRSFPSVMNMKFTYNLATTLVSSSTSVNFM